MAQAHNAIQGSNLQWDTTSTICWGWAAILQPGGWNWWVLCRMCGMEWWKMMDGRLVDHGWSAWLFQRRGWVRRQGVLQVVRVFDSLIDTCGIGYSKHGLLCSSCRMTLNWQGIHQIAVVCGMCTAGGNNWQLSDVKCHSDTVISKSKSNLGDLYNYTWACTKICDAWFFVLWDALALKSHRKPQERCPSLIWSAHVWTIISPNATKPEDWKSNEKPPKFSGLKS